MLVVLDVLVAVVLLVVELRLELDDDLLGLDGESVGLVSSREPEVGTDTAFGSVAAVPAIVEAHPTSSNRPATSAITDLRIAFPPQRRSQHAARRTDPA